MSLTFTTNYYTMNTMPIESPTTLSPIAERILHLIPEESIQRENKLRSLMTTLKNTISELKEIGIIIDYTFDASAFMEEELRIVSTSNMHR